MKRFLNVLLMITLLSISSAFAETYKQIRIGYPDSETFLKILQAGFDPVYAERDNYIDFAVDAVELPEFEMLGVPFTVVHEDMTAFYQSRNPLGLTMGGFKTYSEIAAAMDTFSNTYPSLCLPKYSIGSSSEGRTLWTTKISDNPFNDEEEPEVFVNGVHHAREPIGSEICIEFMRYLLSNYGTDPVATDLIDNYEIYFCPVMNPDGFEYNRTTNPNGGGMWRKNRRNNGDGSYGVDPNRNYNYFWGYDNNGSSPSTSDETYRGPSPASEPENMALQNFESQHDFAIVVNYHSYGSLFLYPWGYYNARAEEAAFYDTLGSYAASIGYDRGAPWELLYNTNGDSNDWGYGEDRTRNKSYSIVIEVGSGFDGFWPQESRIEPLVNENIDILKDLLPRSLNIYKRRLPREPTITSPADGVPNTQFYLHWQHSPLDTFNLAASYRVTQKSDYTRASQGFETTSGYVMDGFARNTTRFHSGAYSIYSGMGNNYRRSITISDRLKVQSNDSLTFWAWYNIQSGFDYAYVQVSTDGGVHWLEINGNLSTTQNPNRRNRGFGITGSSSNAWVRGAYPLSAYAGQEIKIRFYYWTDGSGSSEGIYFDDVFPSDIFGSSTVIAETVYPESLLIGPFSSGYKWFTVESRDDRGHLSPPSDRFRISIVGNRYDLSGHIALSNNPPDLSGSVVRIADFELSDTTDVAGNYVMLDVPEGTFDITASRGGYYPDTAYSFVLAADTTLDFQLVLAPPGVPTLIYPPNSSVIDTEYVAFNWNDVPGVTSYVLEVAGDINFSNLVVLDSNLTVSGYTNQQPLPLDTYYWRVTSHNEGGYSARSPVWVFTVFYTMNAPQLQTPPNSYITDSSYINFDWTDVSRAEHYAIEISRNSGFTDIFEFDSLLTVSNYRNQNPFPNATYYWRVTAYNQQMTSPRSLTRIFTVNNLLQAPVLLSPPDGFLTDTSLVNFDWADVTGAISYVFEAASDPDFNTIIVVDSSVADSALGHDFSDATYYWRVTAYNGSVYSARSAVRDFTVRTALSQPGLIIPLDGYVSDTNLVSFDWGDIVGATAYIFEVANDSNFISHVINDSSRAGSSYQNAGPFADGRYFWRVTATNGMIYSPRSLVRDFEVVTFAGIPAPALISPSDGYISTSAFITFDWTDVGDTITYLFELSTEEDFGSLFMFDSTVFVSTFTNTDSLPNNIYYWRVRATDGQNWSPYSAVWSIIIDRVTDYLPGDANNHGQVNGLDVVYLVNYLKGYGPAPVPFLAGDANGSCDVNGLDVVYLVNYFKGGPYPIRGDCIARFNLERRPADQ
jgi:hypothetical protein